MTARDGIGNRDRIAILALVDVAEEQVTNLAAALKLDSIEQVESCRRLHSCLQAIRTLVGSDTKRGLRSVIEGREQ